MAGDLGQLKVRKSSTRRWERTQFSHMLKSPQSEPTPISAARAGDSSSSHSVDHSTATRSHPSHTMWEGKSGSAHSHGRAAWAQSLFQDRHKPPSVSLSPPALHTAVVVTPQPWSPWKKSPFLSSTGLETLCKGYHKPHPTVTKMEPEESKVTCSSLKSKAASELGNKAS